MSSQYDDLEKLADLNNKGIISEEEFNKEKAKILNIRNSAATTEASLSSNEKMSKLDNNAMGTLVIIRPSAIYGAAIICNINIDECKVGKVSHGETFSISLPVGHHKLSVIADYNEKTIVGSLTKITSQLLRLDNMSSSFMSATPLLINIHEGQTVKFKLLIGIASVKLEPLS